MPRFFFHVFNGEFIPDHAGIDCPTLEEVKDNAVRISGEMLKDQGLQLWRTGHFDMFVCDEHNKTHFRLSFQAEDVRAGNA
jgi:hypothetical protein